MSDMELKEYVEKAIEQRRKILKLRYIVWDSKQVRDGRPTWASADEENEFLVNWDKWLAEIISTDGKSTNRIMNKKDMEYANKLYKKYTDPL